MTQAYVVTEGFTDIEILRRVLPQPIVRKVHFVAGSGKSSILSLAASMLVNHKAPLALVIDADTHNPEKIYEQQDFIQAILNRTASGEMFRVFMAIPEIEAVFFQDRKLLEHIMGRSLRESEWQAAVRDPKAFLQDHLGNYPESLTALFSRISESEIQLIHNHPLIQELTAFLAIGTNGQIQ